MLCQLMEIKADLYHFCFFQSICLCMSQAHTANKVTTESTFIPPQEISIVFYNAALYLGKWWKRIRSFLSRVNQPAAHL